MLSQIRIVVNGCDGLEFLSARDVMEAMESLVQILYSDGFGFTLSETGLLQRTIMKAFNLPLKT
ncbi:MAG: hypothetical protein LBE76_08440 [Nitrososphaerota archaeon]|nr:hypothetical protein [Nitrososphaerota archaeon]